MTTATCRHRPTRTPQGSIPQQLSEHGLEAAVAVPYLPHAQSEQAEFSDVIPETDPYRPVGHT